MRLTSSVPKKRQAIALLAALAILTAGCGSPFPALAPPATGSLTITARLPVSTAAGHGEAASAPSSEFGAAKASVAKAAAVAPMGQMATLAAAYELEVTLTQDKLQVQERRAVSGDTVSLTIDNLYVGRWQLELVVRDGAGQGLYSGSGSVWVSEGATSTVTVPLSPYPGTLDLTVDIGGLSLEQESYKARLVVSPGESYNMDRIEGTALFQTRVNLAPGSYDFKIDFYTDSFHTYKLIYAGYWMPLAIEPGKTVAVYWRPATGAVVVETEPAEPPPAPSAVTADWEGDAIVLAWDAVTQGDVVAYRVYRRVGPLARYELLAEVDAWTTTLVDAPPEDIDGPDNGRSVSYVVTAMGASGKESYRSPEAIVIVP